MPGHPGEERGGGRLARGDGMSLENGSVYLFYLFTYFLILFIHERHRKRQREKQAPHREPDVGLDPRTPGSRPELEAVTQPLSHPGSPYSINYIHSVNLFKDPVLGCLGGSAVQRLPSAQGVILGSWDRVPHRAPCVEPASPSACVSLSLCVSHE